MSRYILSLSVAIAMVSLVSCNRDAPQVQNSAAEPTGNSNLSTNGKTAANDSPEPQWEQISQSLALLGSATKGLDTTNTSPAAQRYQYELLVKMKNTSEAPIEYDKTVWSFSVKGGKPFRIEQTSRDLKDQSKVKTETLKPGEEKEWKFDTNGWTDMIVMKSEGDPIVLEMTVLYKKKAVAGPFQAELPKLDDMTLSETKDSPGNKVTLKFKPQ